MVSKTIKLETKNLLLRKITMDDALPMYNNWASDDEVTKYLSWPAHKNLSVTKEVTSSWINQYTNDFFFQWVIEHKDTKEIIGTINLFNYKDNSLELGYCVSKRYWNKGLTTEACWAVLDFAFNQVGVKKVYARHVDENIASGKVMQKNNMTYVGSNMQFIASKNKMINMCNYVINKEDFE